jgi:extracellular factor (EF) 3-hydroxypalmitic acid methyl ester biosynthesis protein
MMVVCEATLDEAWLDVDLFAMVTEPKKLQADFSEFFQEWKKIDRILPEYKVVLADMQNYFAELKRWLDQVEFGIRSSVSAERTKIELEVVQGLAPTIIPSIDSLFQRFEKIADEVEPDLLPFHRSYAKRQLHPQLLCSPFAYRTYHKPLGYAGDYEMVNMILRDSVEGSSLFSKSINKWFLSQSPAVAHRNRIKYLTQVLVQEAARVVNQGQAARIYNLGCGPAQEIQNFLRGYEISNSVSLTLLDFNDETLEHTGRVLGELIGQNNRKTKLAMVKKSVHQVLKEESKPNHKAEKYDVVYCAGVFDYMSDRICKRLMNIFYDMLGPGGLLVATNVDSCNPLRNGMEYLLDWHLVQRSKKQMKVLIPDLASQDNVQFKSDETGVNLYMEVRKSNEH